MDKFPADELEALIDTYGLASVLEHIAEICHEKADHLRSNWQDARSGRVWDKDAKVISSAANRVNAS